MTSLLILAALASLPASLDTPADVDAVFAKDVLIVQASDYACYRFDVYIAADGPRRSRGLMHVRRLPDTTGMLFVYEDTDYRSMYMRNTYISLDIAFIRADGDIVNIAKGTEPLSLRSIVSAEPATYVLELKAGTTDRLHIDDDSRVLWGPIFGK